MFEIIDIIDTKGITCVIFKPLQCEGKPLVEMYEEFEVNYELYIEDGPLTDLYVLLIDSGNNKAQQLFFVNKGCAIFYCVDLLNQSESKVCDLSTDEHSAFFRLANSNIYKITLSHVDMVTRCVTHIEPKEIALTYLHSNNFNNNK